MRKKDLTQGKVFTTLLALAAPLMGSSMIQFTYNLVDMFWVGRLGSGSVASIGSSSFFINVGYAIHALIMVGTGVQTAHHAGRDDQEQVKSNIHAGMLMSLLFGVLYALILLVCGKTLISFLELNEQSVETNAFYYLAWSAPTLFFACFNNLFARIFASLGNSKSAFKISAIGMIGNMVLDPLLIYVLKGGVAGAAIATLLANILTFVMYLVEGKHYFIFSIREKIVWKDIVAITKLGMPVALQRVLFTGINILLAKMIADFGYYAVAAQKIGVQIESVTYMVTGGLNGAVTSFIGQNAGAKEKKRLSCGYRVAMIIGCVYAIFSSLIFVLFGEQLIALFVREQETISIAADYLRIIAYSQVFNAVEMVSTGFFTGIRKTYIPSVISILFTALRVPMAYGAISYLGIDGVWWSITISTVLKGSILLVMYGRYAYKNLRVDTINKA